MVILARKTNFVTLKNIPRTPCDVLHTIGGENKKMEEKKKKKPLEISPEDEIVSQNT